MSQSVIDQRGSAAGDSRLRWIFHGPYGLRAGWALLLFLVVENLLEACVGFAAERIWHIDGHQAWTPQFLLAGEMVELVIALVATLMMARVERRTLTLYGIPLRRAFGARFWQGILWGVGSAGLVYVLLFAAGAYRVQGLAQHGSDAVIYALLWALAFLGVGLYEEVFFRGYPLFTLSRGMGFWPATLLISLAFGALHYFQKPNESFLDLANVTLIGVLFCFMVRRTGDVWLAIGWHFAFNFASMGIMGSPNSGNLGGQPITGHLLASTFQGPEWLTGGPTGAQASVCTLAMTVVLFAVFHFAYPEARYPQLVRR
jgi:membrane protease YdiL (CAAX protease family)